MKAFDTPQIVRGWKSWYFGSNAECIAIAGVLLLLLRSAYDGTARRGAAQSRDPSPGGAGRDPSQIIETLKDEAAWKEKLGRTPEKLRRLAEEAQREHEHGETRPLDDLL